MIQDTEKNLTPIKKSLFKLSDVEQQDIMHLKFILDKPYLEIKFVLEVPLIKICQWIVKTIVTNHKENRKNDWYKTNIRINYDKDLNYCSPNLQVSHYLYSKITWGMDSKSGLNKINPARYDMQYLLRSSGINGLRIIESREFNSFCYSFVAKYFPEDIRSCLQN